jgi:hypothetical protein
MNHRFDNGTSEKHLPCSSCGKYASETHSSGVAVQPESSPERFSDGSTGMWECTECAAPDPVEQTDQETEEAGRKGHLFQ